MIHSGSRGLGHQVYEDALGSMLHSAVEHGIELVDRELCCAPFGSDTAKDYLSAMASAANFAFVNRQVMAAWARDVFKRLFKAQAHHGLDVCHNIATFGSIPPSAGRPEDQNRSRRLASEGADSVALLRRLLAGGEHGDSRHLRDAVPQGP